jgi:hypothetical protein
MFPTLTAMLSLISASLSKFKIPRLLIASAIFPAVINILFNDLSLSRLESFCCLRKVKNCVNAFELLNKDVLPKCFLQ